MQQPKMMLADEPIASLDPLNAKIVMEALRDINRNDGITVITNLHTLDTARTYCDRIIGMSAGKVVFDGGPDLLDGDAVARIYGSDAIDEAMTLPPRSRPAPKHPPAANRWFWPVSDPAGSTARVKGTANQQDVGATDTSGRHPMLKTILLSAVAVLSLGTAAMAEDLKDFRIGILGGENEADRLRSFQCLVDKLPAAIGVEKVSLFPAADYDGVVQGLLGGTLDYAELGASGYAKIFLANEKAVEPILTTIQTDGSTGYYSIMVARKDSGITDLAGLKGKKLGFADADSTSATSCRSSRCRSSSACRSRNISRKPALAAVMRTSSSKWSRAPSMPARPSVRASASSRTATPRATCARWSTRVSSTWTNSSNCALAADPERSDRRSHRPQCRPEGQVQAVHG